MADREEVLARAFGQTLQKRADAILMNVEAREARLQESIAFLQGEVRRLEGLLSVKRAEPVVNVSPKPPDVIVNVPVPNANVINEVAAPIVNVEPTFSPVFQPPEVVVTPAPIQPITINCDMTPVANVLTGFAKIILKQQEELTNNQEMLSQLLQVLSTQPAPIVRPIIKVAPTPINPQVTLNTPERKSKKSWTVKANGKTMTIEED